jgi:hypothetical protein
MHPKISEKTCSAFTIPGCILYTALKHVQTLLLCTVWKQRHGMMLLVNLNHIFVQMLKTLLAQLAQEDIKAITGLLA